MYKSIYASANVAALALCCAMGWSGPAAAATLTVSPSTVQSEAPYTITGAGFAAGEAVTLGELTLAANASGAFTYEGAAPGSPGSYTFTAVGAAAGDGASATLTVEDDWPQYRYGSEKHGNNPYDGGLSIDSSTPIDIVWSAATGGPISSSPAVVGGIVYVGSMDGALYAFNATTGAKIWSAKTGGKIRSSPAVVNGIAYVGSEDWRLYAFDALTGKLKWKARTGGPITSSPLVANGLVYVGSQDEKIYAFSPSSGTQVWAVATGGQVNSSPAYDLGSLYVGSGDDYVYALNATTGAKRWKYKTGGAVSASPTVTGGAVYVGSADKKIYALSEATGTLAWSYTTGGAITASPAASEYALWVGSANGVLYEFNLDGEDTPGTVEASYNTASAISAITLTGYNSGPYATLANGGIFVPGDCCISSNTVIAVPAAALSSVTFSGDMAFFGAADGNLYALANAPAGQQQVVSAGRPAKQARLIHISAK
jgi:outer membrane protein assembly factor BamB